MINCKLNQVIFWRRDRKHSKISTSVPRALFAAVLMFIFVHSLFPEYSVLFLSEFSTNHEDFQHIFHLFQIESFISVSVGCWDWIWLNFKLHDLFVCFFIVNHSFLAVLEISFFSEYNFKLAVTSVCIEQDMHSALLNWWKTKSSQRVYNRMCRHIATWHKNPEIMFMFLSFWGCTHSRCCCKYE